MAGVAPPIVTHYVNITDTHLFNILKKSCTPFPSVPPGTIPPFQYHSALTLPPSEDPHYNTGAATPFSGPFDTELPPFQDLHCKTPQPLEEGIKQHTTMGSPKILLQCTQPG